jgi:hypothetical protein
MILPQTISTYIIKIKLDKKIKITIERTKTNKSKVNWEKNLYGVIYEYENLNKEKEIMEIVVRKIDELKSTIALL